VNGLLVVDKPASWTSHDVVARVKGRLRAARVGHLGTLDPAVTGVLPLVINRATKFARWIEGGVKEYEGTMTLGVETDTYDAGGVVTGKGETLAITSEAIEKAFGLFRGQIRQVPPMYSAVKRRGMPLYKLARKGMVVERPERDVEIFSLDVLDISMPQVDFRVSCSRGTYIRSICFDVGRALGCGAHLHRLRRIRSGFFDISEAIDPTLDGDLLKGAIIPLDDVLHRVCGAFRAVPVDELIAPLEPAIGLRLNLPECEGISPFHDAGEMVRFTLGGTDAALAQHIEGSIYKIKWVFEGDFEKSRQEALAAR